MIRTTCRVTLVTKPAAVAIPAKSALCETGSFEQGPFVNSNGGIRRLCWTADRANVWFECTTLKGDATLELVSGDADLVRSLFEGEIAHYGLKAKWH